MSGRIGGKRRSTRPPLRVDRIETSHRDGSVELAGTVHGLLAGGGTRRLWFRFPEALAEGVTPTADPFLAALLPAAMLYRRPLEIAGDVSPRLLQQVGQLMQVMSWQNRIFKPVPVAAGTWQGNSSRGATGAFFSGGVDSFYTLLKNRELAHGPDRIAHLLCVCGFDLDADNEAMFAAVSGRLRQVAAAFDVELHEVRTNVREAFQPMLNWTFEQIGAGLAAVGLALGPLLGRVLIPSSDTTLPSVRWLPSNPLTDPLWSTDATEFIHDGCEATRLQRIQRRLAASELALRHLRVCFANYRRGAATRWNCGRCDKCLHTMVQLAAAGVLERCPAFAGLPLEPAAVRRLRPYPRDHAVQLGEALARLERDGRCAELRAVLRVIVSRRRQLARHAVVLLRDALRRLAGAHLPRLRRWRRERRAPAAVTGSPTARSRSEPGPSRTTCRRRRSARPSPRTRSG